MSDIIMDDPEENIGQNNENNENNDSPQDHLMNFIQDQEKTSKPQEFDNIERFGPNTRQKVDKIELNSDWQEISIDQLPFGKFYPIGTHIFIRPLSTQEIQAFAVVNDKNPYDVQLKLNEVLASCTKITFIDGQVGTYKDLMDGDRDTLAIILSRATAKHGKRVEKPVTCDCKIAGGEEQMVELIPANYVYKVEDPDIAQFFNADKRVYDIEMYNGVNIPLAPPTIGLTEDINNYIFYKTTKSEGKVLPNISFIQCIGYIKAGKGVKSISIDQLEQEEYNFGKMNPDVFEVTYAAVDLMNFGIEKVKTKCKKCGKELTTPFSFPGGPRNLFLVPNAFKQLTRQRI